MSTKGKGYYIRTDRGNYQTDLQHVWGVAGTLPPEWEATKQDATIKEAQIFSSTQRNRQHNKRKILDSHNGQGAS